MSTFDYAWYRVAKLYYKWDSDGITASAFLGLSLGILINDLIYLIIYYTDVFDSFYQDISVETYGKIGLVVTLSIVVYNYFRYRKMYWVLRGKWKDEPKGILYALKGLALILALVFPLVLLFWLVR